MAAPAGLRAIIEAYEAKRDEVEREHLGRYVVFRDRKIVDAFESSDNAITHSLETFGVAPDLFGQVGARRTIQLAFLLALGQTRADS